MGVLTAEVGTGWSERFAAARQGEGGSWPACDHGGSCQEGVFAYQNSAIRYRDQGRARVYYEQCLHCGRNLGARRTLAVIEDECLAQIAPFDDGLRSFWQEWAQGEYDRRREEGRRRWLAIYDEYLRSPEWQVLRAKVLQRAGHRCEGCGEARGVQVHHLTYERVGRELLFDLVAICQACHWRAHGRDF